MKIKFENLGQQYTSDLKAGVSLAKPIQFSESETNPWQVESASKSPVRVDDFVGNTTAGGPCNVDRLSLVPHCHGTHTETIGHIVDSDHFVTDILIPPVVSAVMVSVRPIVASKTSDTYQPLLKDADQVITADLLAAQLDKWKEFSVNALIVRTGSSRAFFTSEAMAAIAETGVQHLLVDLPSVDRLDDDGLLSNHRIFWNVESGSRQVNANSRLTHTITELIQVPSQINDGHCLLSIQVPSIDSDAALSRPIMLPITRI